MSWLLFIGAIILISVIRKKVKLPGAGALVVGAVVGFLTLVAGASFFQTGPGHWLAGLFGSLLGFLGFPVAPAAAILTIVATIVVVADVKDKQVNGPALTALFLLPGLVLLFGGPLATMWASLGAGAQGIASNALSGIGG